MQLTPVKSSNVAAIGYENGILEVSFLNGSHYQYFHVPEPVYRDFIAAESKGKFVHQHLKNKYPYQKIS